MQPPHVSMIEPDTSTALAMEDIELHKENIIPLKQGRKASVLASLYSPAVSSAAASVTSVSAPTTSTGDLATNAQNPLAVRSLSSAGSAGSSSSITTTLPSHIDAEIQRQQAEFEKKIARLLSIADRQNQESELSPTDSCTPEEADPLDTFHQYVQFIQQHYPSSSSSSTLLNLVLEKALQAFKQDERYINDPRYLKMWILYARVGVDEPREVFKYLEVNDIGQDLGLFYEEYGKLLEECRRFKDADDILQLGIHRHAQPFERLSRKYREFQRRMASRPLVNDDTTSASIAANGREDRLRDENSFPGRTPLSTVTTSTESTSVRDPVSQRSASLSSTYSSSSQTQTTRPRPKPLQTRSSVFDDTTAASTTSGSSSSSSSSTQATTTTWSEFGTAASRKKENVREPEPWKGATMPQKQRSLVRQRSKIEVFDENPTPPTKPAVPPPTTSATEKPKRPEIFKCSLNLIYPNGHEDECPNRIDVSFEELKMMSKLEYQYQFTEESSGQEEDVVMDIHDDGEDVNDVEMNKGVAEKRKQTPPPKVKKGLSERRVMFEDTLSETLPPAESNESKHKPSLQVTKFPSPPRPTKTALSARKVDDECSTPVNAVHAEASLKATKFPSPPRPAQSQSHKTVREKQVPVFTDVNEGSELKVNRFPSPPRPKKVLGERKDPAKIKDNETEEMGELKMTRFPSPPRPQPRDTHKDAFDDVLGKMRPPSPPTIAPSSDIYAVDSPIAPRPKLQSFPSPPRPKTKPKARPPSPTINTKAALADVYGWFNAVNNDDEEPEILEDDTIPVPYMQRLTAAVPTVGVFNEEAEEEIKKSVVFDDEEEQEDQGKQYQDRVFDENCTIARIGFKPDKKTPVHAASTTTQPRKPLGSRPYHTSITAVSEDDDVEFSHATVRPHHINEVTETSLKLDRTIAGFSTIADLSHVTLAEDEEDGRCGLESGIEELVISPDMEHDENVVLDVPNPCNPMIEETIGKAVKVVRRRIHSLKGYTKIDSLENGISFAKRFKSAVSTSLSTSCISLPFTGETREQAFDILKLIGQGSFASVYLARAKKPHRSFDLDNISHILNDDEDIFAEWDAEFNQQRSHVAPAAITNNEPKLSAIKVQEPPFEWEFYIIRLLHERLPPSLSRSIVEVDGLVVAPKESMMLMEYGSHGTILDFVNRMSKDGFFGGVTGSDEVIAAYFTCEILKLVEGLHAAGIIHGDMKADNLLVRAEPEDEIEGWSSTYSPIGQQGWSKKGFKVVDWGRAIQVDMFPPNQKFVVNVDTTSDESVECYEMRNGKPFTYQADWYGVAGILHVLLFGKYMRVVTTPWPSADVMAVNADIPRIQLASSLKRYWMPQWKTLFDLLLNAGMYSVSPALLSTMSRDTEGVEEYLCSRYTDYRGLENTFPVVGAIRQCRKEMERWVVENSNKGRSLKSLLKKGLSGSA